jgi:hypothetical protein
MNSRKKNAECNILMDGIDYDVIAIEISFGTNPALVEDNLFHGAITEGGIHKCH